MNQNTDQPKKQLEIPENFTNLELSIGELADYISTLEKRLISITRQAQPSLKETVENKEPAQSTEQGGYIYTLTQRVKNQIGEVRSIIDRLEL